MKMLRFLAVGFLLAVGAGVVCAAEAPAKRPITHEDVWLMKRVGSPVPSPDGKWVVFSVTDPAYDAKEQGTDLWLKSLTSEEPARRITFNKGGETGPAWSPDSKKIVFAAKRDTDEAAQLYVLDLAAGGEAERITSLSQGARAPQWSPDGKYLLLVSDVFPGANDEEAIKKATKERKERKYSARTYDEFPPRFWDKWLDDKRPALFVQEAKAGAPAKNLFAESKIAASVGFGVLESFSVEWAPDSRSVVFAVALNRHEAAHANVNTQILQAKLDGGELVRLTQDTHSYSDLAFSPDGRWLLCTTTAETPGEVYDLSRLAAFPWPFKNERKVLTAALDRAVADFATPEGSDRIYFTYEHAGLMKLYSIAYTGGEVRAEKSPATGVIGGLAAGGAALVGTWDSAVSPMEIYAFNGEPKRLTSINVERAALIDWLPVEHFAFKASNGDTVHNLLVKPAGFDPAKKYPLFTVIHGGAASMWRDSFVLRWNYHLLARPGYVVLLTDYKGSTGYGEAFSRSIKLDPLKGPGDHVNEAVDAAIKRYAFVDGTKLAAGGASYGGHLANWLQATTTRYKAIVSHAGEADLIMQWGTSDSIFGREVNAGSPIWGDSPVWREQSPALQAGNHAKGTGFKTPILITVGELDYRVPANNAYMWFALNRRLQVPSRFVIFPDENHWILKGENSRYFYSQIHEWLAKYVK